MTFPFNDAGGPSDTVRSARVHALGRVLFEPPGGHLSQDEAEALLHRVLAMEKAPHSSSTAPFSQLEADHLRASWRILRWILQAAGYSEPNTPLSAALSDPDLIRAIGKRSLDPYALLPITPRVRPGAELLPFKTAFRDTFRPGVSWLTPLTPEEKAQDAALDDPSNFKAQSALALALHKSRQEDDPDRDPLYGVDLTQAMRPAPGSPCLLFPEPKVKFRTRHPESVYLPAQDPSWATADAWALACEALQLSPTARASRPGEPGIQGLVPMHSLGGTTPESLTIAWEYCPTLDAILEFEARFLTTAADVLADSNEDALRRYLRETLCPTDWEAFSIVQTVRYWAAASRPIEPEVERALMVRSLEQTRERALKIGDVGGSIAANRLLASIMGLNQTLPGLTQDQQFRSFDNFAKGQQLAIQRAYEQDPGSLPEEPALTPFEEIE